MKYSLLELVQNVLSSLDSDEVDSINDTAEARQIAQIVRQCYFNIVARADLPELKNIFSLTASGSSLKPVLMTFPSNVTTMEWIKYNKLTPDLTTETFTYVTKLPLQQFLEMIHSMLESESNVDVMSHGGFDYLYRNDKNPDFCTVLSDSTVIFDSFLNTMETTLQSSKTLCYGNTVPTFSLLDTYTPSLDDQQFPLLLNEAKSMAMLELKQQPNQSAVQESRRQWRTLQRTKSIDKVPTPFDALPNFGRHGACLTNGRWINRCR